MIVKRINSVFLAAALIVMIAPSCYGQYTTDWLANTFGTNAARVGNVARSMWVAPESVIYTSLSSNPATQITNFSYVLNGTTVTTSLPGGVLFYSVADGGGFDLYPTINNTSDVGVISFLFPNDVGSNLNIVGGEFQASIELKRWHHYCRWPHSWLRFRHGDHRLCRYTRTAQHHLVGDSAPVERRPDSFPSYAQRANLHR